MYILSPGSLDHNLVLTAFYVPSSFDSGPYYTATQKVSPESTAPDSQSLQSMRCSNSTLPGNLLPRISQLT